MLTDEELREIREQHRPVNWDYGGQVCEAESTHKLGADWPCDAVRLLDEIKRLRIALAEAELDYACEGGCGPQEIARARATLVAVQAS